MRHPIYKSRPCDRHRNIICFLMVKCQIAAFTGTAYFVHENKKAPMAKNTTLMMERMVISGRIATSPAPSLMILRAAVNRWVRGKAWENNWTHRGAPSIENQTSDRNIMGHEIKFKIPVVNSSLVPRAARISPRDVRLRLPRKNTSTRCT